MKPEKIEILENGMMKEGIIKNSTTHFRIDSMKDFKSFLFCMESCFENKENVFLEVIVREWDKTKEDEFYDSLKTNYPHM